MNVRAHERRVARGCRTFPKSFETEGQAGEGCPGPAFIRWSVCLISVLTIGLKKVKLSGYYAKVIILWWNYGHLVWPLPADTH
ncbi:MAG: hypothetical protein ACLTZU_11920 [Odoribacter splanchnicus]